ncbi:MAG TPA: site-2 protease family protein [Ignavibacteriaceae bacterium]|nr:site-2 protease family protein [Ignavibacteriaceae bacterium]
MPDIQVSQKLISFLTFLPMFIISIAVHEFAHAIMAFKFGDDTAKKQGRLTLNPIKHADLVGTIIMPLASFASGFALIGWAKPVPVDRSNFKNAYRDDAIVSFAGPLSNFILAVLFFVCFLLLVNSSTPVSDNIINIFWYGVFFNIFLFAFNLIPIPPLDGSHILFDLFPNRFTAKLMSLGLYGSLILLLFIYSPLWGFFMKLINFILSLFLQIGNVPNG